MYTKNLHGHVWYGMSEANHNLLTTKVLLQATFMAFIQIKNLYWGFQRLEM